MLKKLIKKDKPAIPSEDDKQPTPKRKHVISKKIARFVALFIILISTAVLVVYIARIITRPTIEDDYFVTDETKTTISLTPDSKDSNNTSLVQTHFVYTYDGDNVSGLRTYFEYPDEETARNTLESIKDQPEFKGAVVEGKYIVVTADESQYKGLTASDIKQQADALKSFQESQEKTKESK